MSMFIMSLVFIFGFICGTILSISMVFRNLRKKHRAEFLAAIDEIEDDDYDEEDDLTEQTHRRIKDFVKKTGQLEVYIEMENNKYYAYHTDTSVYIATGSSVKAVILKVQRVYPTYEIEYTIHDTV